MINFILSNQFRSREEYNMLQCKRCNKIVTTAFWFFLPHGFDLAWSGSCWRVRSTVDFLNKLLGQPKLGQNLSGFIAGQSALISNQVKHGQVHSLERLQEKMYKIPICFIYKKWILISSYLPLFLLQGCKQQWWDVVLQGLTGIGGGYVSGLDEVWVITDPL